MCHHWYGPDLLDDSHFRASHALSCIVTQRPKQRVGSCLCFSANAWTRQEVALPQSKSPSLTSRSACLTAEPLYFWGKVGVDSGTEPWHPKRAHQYGHCPDVRYDGWICDTIRGCSIAVLTPGRDGKQDRVHSTSATLRERPSQAVERGPNDPAGADGTRSSEVRRSLERTCSKPDQSNTK